MNCAITGCRYVATHDIRQTIGKTSAPLAVCTLDSVGLLARLIQQRDAKYMTVTLTSRVAPPTNDAVMRKTQGQYVDELRGAPRARCTIPGCRKLARFEVETITAGTLADPISACSDDAPHVLTALASDLGFERVSVTIASRWQRPNAPELLAAHGV